MSDVDRMKRADLTEFLLARIAEDEAVARRWADDVDGLAPDGRPWRDSLGHYIWAPKARVLAECAAKRQLLDATFKMAAIVDEEWGCCHSAREIRSGVIRANCKGPDAAHPFLLALALPYASHQDFRDEWTEDRE